MCDIPWHGESIVSWLDQQIPGGLVAQVAFAQIFRGKMVMLSTHSDRSSRAAQMALRGLQAVNPKLAFDLVIDLKGSIHSLSMDRYGFSVLKCIIEILHGSHIMGEALDGHARSVAQSKFGCQIILSLLNHAKGCRARS